MPGDPDDPDYYDEEGDWDDAYYDDEELPDVDAEDLYLPDPRSEDEQFNGVNMRPPSGYSYQPEPPEDRVPRSHPPRPGGGRRGRRLPPMPRVPRSQRQDGDVWVPPFDVLPDGTVVGVPLSQDGAPPIAELPEMIMPDGTRTVMDPGKGSMEGVSQIILGRPG